MTDSQREEHLVKWKDTAVMTQRWRLVNPTTDGDETKLELYDIARDPGQKSNIAAQYPDVVQHLKAEYDQWWKKASAVADEYVRIELGSEKENPSILDCMDWHGAGANEVWNQKQIRTGPSVNGFWAVKISRPGRYRFELRRWPRELDLRVEAPYVQSVPNMEKTPGVAISAKRARLTVGGVDVSKPVQPGDKYTEFVVSLAGGPAECKRHFTARTEPNAARTMCMSSACSISGPCQQHVSHFWGRELVGVMITSSTTANVFETWGASFECPRSD